MKPPTSRQRAGLDEEYNQKLMEDWEANNQGEPPPVGGLRFFPLKRRKPVAKVTIILEDLKGGGADMSIHFDPEPAGSLTPAQAVASGLLTLLRGKITETNKKNKKAPTVGAKG